MGKTYLIHSGTKGMKWGVRRYQNKDGSLTPLGKKRYETSSKKTDKRHEDYKKAHTKKSIKEMSDAELRERNNRLNMERQYKDLTKKKGIGKKIITTFVAGGATVAAVSGAATKYSKAGNKVLDKIGDYAVKNKKFGDKIMKIDFSKPLTD